MSTYRGVEGATGMKADRVTSAARAMRIEPKSLPTNGGHQRLSLVQELPRE